MFTGIVAARGRVQHIQPGEGNSLRLEISVQSDSDLLADAQLGDSISVNGVCLTAVDFLVEQDTPVTVAESELPRRLGFTADVIAETIQRSTLGSLREGELLNLEAALRLSDRLGGHLVQGHVDGVGTVVARSGAADGDTVEIEIPSSLLRFVVTKGSVAVDGVSLTVTQVSQTSFQVQLIPATLAATTLGERPVGAQVNVEVDVMAKHAEKLLAGFVGRPAENET